MKKINKYAVLVLGAIIVTTGASGTVSADEHKEGREGFFKDLREDNKDFRKKMKEEREHLRNGREEMKEKRHDEREDRKEIGKKMRENRIHNEDELRDGFKKERKEFRDEYKQKRKDLGRRLLEEENILKDNPNTTDEERAAVKKADEERRTVLRAAIQEKRESMRAETKEKRADFKGKARAERTEFQKENKDLKKEFQGTAKDRLVERIKHIYTRIDNAQKRFEKLAVRIQSYLDKKKDSGVDIAKAQKALNETLEWRKITAEKVAETKNLIEIMVESENPKEMIPKLRESVKNAARAIRGTNKAMKAAIKAARALK